MKKILLAVAFMALSAIYASAQTTVSGNITANGSTCTPSTCVSLVPQPQANIGTATIQITGTFVATIEFEASLDQSGTFVAVEAAPIGGGASVTSTPSAGIWQVSMAGIQSLQVRASAYTSGTAAVLIQQSQATTGGGDSVTISGTPAVNVTQVGSTAVLTCTTAGCLVTAVGVVGAITPTGLTNGTNRSLMIDPNGAARTAVSNAGYLAVVSATSSVINGGSGPTDAILVTVGAAQRIVLHELTVTCGSTVTNAITLSVGLGTATIPASGAGLVETFTTAASAFQGIQRGTGFPSILAVGATGEDLRLTSTNPSAGSCPVSYVYSLEGV